MSRANVRAASALVADDAAGQSREFVFTEADFRFLVQFAYEHAGIALGESKRNLIYSRLSRRLRTLGLTSFREYCEYLVATPSELEGFINAISTNLTKFFREAHHFEHFRDHVAIPFAQAAQRASGLRLRIWSAGCSTGEEPYTIAAVLRSEVRNLAQHDVRILATDIDTEVLSKASAGIYSADAIDEVPKTYREYFRSDGSRQPGMISVAPELRALITFRRLNLIEPWPFSGRFDAVFCRNVMIYFDGPTKTSLVERFTQIIKPGGWLYIGHSESLLGLHPGLRLVGRTVYQREE